MGLDSAPSGIDSVDERGSNSENTEEPSQD